MVIWGANIYFFLFFSFQIPPDFSPLSLPRCNVVPSPPYFTFGLRPIFFFFWFLIFNIYIYILIKSDICCIFFGRTWHLSVSVKFVDGKQFQRVI
jgi:hypothetical protein